MSDIGEEVKMYCNYLFALVRPGHPVQTFSAYPLTPADISSWDNDELKVLIEEGRRQLDRQMREHERIQARSQFLFTTALALTAVLAASVKRVASRESVILFLLWGFGMLIVGLGLLGAASLLAVRAEFRAIDAALLSRKPQGEVISKLAQDYAGMMNTGESTLSTRLTLYRDAVLLVVISAVIEAVIWCITLL